MSWSLDDRLTHSLDSRQFFDMRESTLPNGMRIIDAYNAAGLHFTLLPDRGMDIWTAHYKGMPLTWVAPGSPFPPDEAQDWRRQFNGGLLTTCGLMHVGPPEHDDQSGEYRDLHGRFTRLRATQIGVKAEAERIERCGELSETRLFAEQLHVRRAYTLHLDQPVIELSDRITNLGDTPAPFMLLYHVNLGFPLVREGSQLIAPYECVMPRDARASAGFETWKYYEKASPGYEEQVFFHHLKAGADGMTEIALLNEDVGLSLRFNVEQMPYFTQWKNTRQGIYVCGVEPGNCLPEGQNAARASGRLQMLQPGESVVKSLTITILEGKYAMRQARDRIAELDWSGDPAAGCRLSG